VASKRITAGKTPFRGPVRKKRIIFGAPSNIPVPISRFAARQVPSAGIVARYAPGTTKDLKRFSVGGVKDL
jgi:hypothetical protein